MPRTVSEVMNAELFSLRSGDGTSEALGYILGLGITGAPVLDAAKRPIGVVSMRDLLRTPAPGTVAACMTVPAVTVPATASIEDAARAAADGGVHRVVVVDAKGRAVGVASSLDLVRGLLGMPAFHPATFPHWDKARGVSWTDDTLLELDRVGGAPNGPGVLVLIRGGRNLEERVVWAETAHNVRTRLHDLLSRPQDDQPLLRRIIELYSGLRFRAALVTLADQREAIAESLMAQALSAPAPTQTD
ncbi:MAG: CBS domain-containing protein [Myxococcales bacterium]|nr:CBS domain-containing protein [Myxococcales bacterium]